MQITGDMTVLHRRALDVVGRVAGGITAADLARPTPCAGWDLRALLAHAIGQNHGFADAAERDVGVEAFAARPVPDDPSPAWTESAQRVGDALAAAVAAQRTVLLAEFPEFGRLPAAVVLSMHLLDTVVHGWDVATALEQPYRPDDELVTAVAAIAQMVPAGADRERPGASFGPVVDGSTDDPWLSTLHHLGRR